jgi:hypothetical protein
MTPTLTKFPGCTGSVQNTSLIGRVWNAARNGATAPTCAHVPVPLDPVLSPVHRPATIADQFPSAEAIWSDGSA